MFICLSFCFIILENMYMQPMFYCWNSWVISSYTFFLKHYCFLCKLFIYWISFFLQYREHILRTFLSAVYYPELLAPILTSKYIVTMILDWLKWGSCFTLEKCTKTKTGCHWPSLSNGVFTSTNIAQYCTHIPSTRTHHAGSLFWTDHVTVWLIPMEVR